MAHQANDLGNHELPLDRERPPGPTPAPAAASPPCPQHTHLEQGHSTTGTARLTPGSGLDTWKGCERRPVPRAQGLVQLERVPASKGARCRQAAPPQVTWELYRWTEASQGQVTQNCGVQWVTPHVCPTQTRPETWGTKLKL